jgi:hypothetical protein
MKFRAEVRRSHPQLVDLARLRAKLEEGLDQSAQQVHVDLARPTNTWQTAVKFTVKKLAYAREISTGNAIYGYVSGGTRPHIIRAKNGRALAFGPSSPKTRPGSLEGGSGSRGSADTFRQQVRHPGTDPRNFDKLAAELAQDEFPKRVQQAIDEGVQP